MGEIRANEAQRQTPRIIKRAVEIKDDGTQGGKIYGVNHNLKVLH
jgi:hypothetical protein